MAKSDPQKDEKVLSPTDKKHHHKKKKEKKKHKHQKEKKDKRKRRKSDDEEEDTGITENIGAPTNAVMAVSAPPANEDNGRHTKKKYKKVKVEEVLASNTDDILALKAKSTKQDDKKVKRKHKKKTKKEDHEDSDKKVERSKSSPTTFAADAERIKAIVKNGESSAKAEDEEQKKKKSKKRKKSSTVEDEHDTEERRTKDSKRQRTEEKSEVTSAAKNIVVKGDKKTDHGDSRIVESSALDFTDQPSQKNGVTLVLFYQYVEPIWSLEKYQQVLKDMEKLGKKLDITGRMRVAREGLNCTLTSSRENIIKFCQTLRKKPEFETTEFKLTNDLPQQQRLPHLKVIEVIELVHYGLEGEKAPPIQEYKGCHLEPKDYHQKIAEKDTVMIDVRNHYEAIIGHFQPPGKDQWLDPMMRKSTEFPVWLDKPETKEKLKGKQVLMYCTGGIRCERATALLKYKMENDPEIKDLGIKEVYQLQGGIDKYFKEFPDGGFWIGKNYVFDKRCAHAPPEVEGKERKGEVKTEPMGKCEACQKPWDRFRGKRRCPTCGVPSLICKECFLEDQKTKKRKLREVRCDLCVAENVTSKAQLRAKEQMEIELYERKLVDQGLIPQPEVQGERLKVTSSGADLRDIPKSKPASKQKMKDNKIKKNGHDKTKDNDKKAKENDKKKKRPSPKKISNPDKVTRLYLKNMCRETMNEETLMGFLPGITHIVWKSDGKTGQFLGQGWVEMATPEDAAKAVSKNGQRVLNRPLYINFQPADPKDVWPPPRTSVEHLSSS